MGPTVTPTPPEPRQQASWARLRPGRSLTRPTDLDLDSAKSVRRPGIAQVTSFGGAKAAAGRNPRPVSAPGGPCQSAASNTFGEWTEPPEARDGPRCGPLDDVRLADGRRRLADLSRLQRAQGAAIPERELTEARLLYSVPGHALRLRKLESRNRSRSETALPGAPAACLRQTPEAEGARRLLLHMRRSHEDLCETLPAAQMFLMPPRRKTKTCPGAHFRESFAGAFAAALARTNTQLEAEEADVAVGSDVDEKRQPSKRKTVLLTPLSLVDA